jgi:hypothetical protein
MGVALAVAHLDQRSCVEQSIGFTFGPADGNRPRGEFYADTAMIVDATRCHGFQALRQQ